MVSNKGKQRFIIVAVSLVMIAVALPATTQAWHDPMQPQGGDVLSEESEAETALTLSSILMAQQRRVAIVNNRVVTVGDQINGYRVVSISPRQVELQKGTKHHRLQLAGSQQTPTVKRKTTE